MARFASRRLRRPPVRRLMSRPILWACVLIAGTVALYTGARSARSSVNAAALAPSAPGAAAQQPLRATRGVHMIVPQDRQVFRVATRLPDGRIALSHATGTQLAESHARAAASSDPLTSGKEERNDR